MFAKLHPLLKIGIWGLAVAVSAAAVQGITWLLGIDFALHLGAGSGVILAFALGYLLVMMSLDQRPITDYGIFVGPQWKKLLFTGVAIGIATYGGYMAVAYAAGAYQLSPNPAPAKAWIYVVPAMMMALPVAMVQQILFSGYLLSVLRDRYNAVVAVLITAFIFAVPVRLIDPEHAFTARSAATIFGLFLTATLLGLLRLITGSILLPAGLLAGWIVTRRAIHKGDLLHHTNSEIASWFVVNSDPRQAPMMFILLGTAVAVCGVVLSRRGEKKIAATEATIDPNFKRIFPLSQASMLAPLDVWIPRLVHARFAIGPAYIPRLIATLVFSTANTILTLPERLILPLLIRNRQVKPPVFILGVHRSGTTHLHNMLALDPQFCSPRAYHIMNPAGFTFSGWLVTPLLGLFMPWKRPMDSVRFHLFSPQEEEFAIQGVSHASPYWGIAFPRQWAHYDKYIFPDSLPKDEKRKWQQAYLGFVRRLCLFRGSRTPLLKNPYNTGRPAALRELFPGCKFIHISRHPYAVYRSNMHMAKEGHVVSQLQDPDERDNYQTRFLDNYHAMEQAYLAETADLPQGDLAEVRFEDLEGNELEQIKRLYAELGLEFSPAFERRLTRYLESIAGYKKNSYRPLPDAIRATIDGKLSWLMQRYGYTTDGSALPLQQQQSTVSQRAA